MNIEKQNDDHNQLDNEEEEVILNCECRLNNFIHYDMHA